MASMKNFDRLGVVVSEVSKTYEWESNDYDMDGSGDCGSLISRGWEKARDKIVQSFGFVNFQHFMAVLTKRTSERFVYFSGIH